MAWTSTTQDPTRSGSPAGGDAIGVPVDAGGTAVLPAGVPLAHAGFQAQGGDLVIVAEDGRSFRIDGYFETLPRPDIATPAGSHLGPDIVDALLLSASPALAPAFTGIADVVGRIEALAGEAAVVHPDGGREAATQGMLLHKGDVLETAPDSGLGLGFPDGSGFALSGNGQLILDELWFDAEGGLGAARLFVGRGGFAVTPGELAAAAGDAFVVRTPTASLTVKGAATGGVVGSDGGTVATVFEPVDDDGLSGGLSGGIVVRTQAGEVLLDRPGMAVGAEDMMLRPTQPFRLGPRDADGFFGDAIALVPGGPAVFGAARVGRLAEALTRDAVLAAAAVAEAREAGGDDFLEDPLAFDDPAEAPGRWAPTTLASVDVGARALAAGEAAAKRAFDAALQAGKPAAAALEAAILAADEAGGPASVEMALAAGPQGLAAPGAAVHGVAGTGCFTAGTSADAGDAIDGGFGSIDGGFAYGFRFEPPRLLFVSRADEGEERRDDPCLPGAATAATADASVAIILAGTDAAELLAGDDGPTSVTALAGDDVVYGDAPTSLLAGTHTAASPLLDPVFAAGAADTAWGGREGADAGTDTAIYADAGAGVTIDLAAAAASGAATGTDALAGIDNAAGTAHDDGLFGDAGDNRLEGLGGADLIRGLAGDDELFGFAGDDVLVGGAGAGPFTFEGGSGAAATGDALVLPDAGFGLGAGGSLADGATYFETATALSSTPLDLSGGAPGPAMVMVGAGSGDGGVAVYYTEDASAATAANSYLIARLDGIDTAAVAAGDVTLKA